MRGVQVSTPYVITISLCFPWLPQSSPRLRASWFPPFFSLMPHSPFHRYLVVFPLRNPVPFFLWVIFSKSNTLVRFSGSPFPPPTRPWEVFPLVPPYWSFSPSPLPPFGVLVTDPDVKRFFLKCYALLPRSVLGCSFFFLPCPTPFPRKQNLTAFFDLFPHSFFPALPQKVTFYSFLLDMTSLRPQFLRFQQFAFPLDCYPVFCCDDTWFSPQVYRVFYLCWSFSGFRYFNFFFFFFSGPSHKVRVSPRASPIESRWFSVVPCPPSHGLFFFLFYCSPFLYASWPSPKLLRLLVFYFFYFFLLYLARFGSYPLFFFSPGNHSKLALAPSSVWEKSRLGNILAPSLVDIIYPWFFQFCLPSLALKRFIWYIFKLVSYSVGPLSWSLLFSPKMRIFVFIVLPVPIRFPGAFWFFFLDIFRFARHSLEISAIASPTLQPFPTRLRLFVISDSNPPVPFIGMVALVPHPFVCKFHWNLVGSFPSIPPAEDPFALNPCFPFWTPFPFFIPPPDPFWWFSFLVFFFVITNFPP